MKHTIKLNAGAAALLQSCLRRPEWSTNAQELVTGLMLADKITTNQKMADLDAKKPVEFILPESLRDLCKKAVDGCGKSGCLPASEYSKVLALALGIVSEPKELADVEFKPAP